MNKSSEETAIRRIDDIITEVLRDEARKGKTPPEKRVTNQVLREIEKRNGLEALEVERARADLESMFLKSRWKTSVIVAGLVGAYLERHGLELPEVLSKRDRKKAHDDANLSRAVIEYLERHGFESLADAALQEKATVSPAKQSKRKH